MGFNLSAWALRNRQIVLFLMILFSFYVFGKVYILKMFTGCRIFGWSFC